ADGDNQVWLPIQPPPAELRYIKAEAVVKAGAPEQANPPAPAGAFGAPAPAPGPVQALPVSRGPASGVPAAVPAQPGSPEALFVEAEQAEQTGRTAEAERLYRELADRVRESNYDLALRCYNRIYFLRQNQTAARPTEVRYGGAATDNRVYPVPTSAG